MPLTLIKADTAEEMVIGLAQAYGYHDPIGGPLWWSDFMQWYYSLVLRIRNGPPPVVPHEFTPEEMVRWYFKKDKIKQSTHVWFHDASVAFNELKLSQPDHEDVNAPVLIAAYCFAEEYNPWHASFAVVNMTGVPLSLPGPAAMLSQAVPSVPTPTPAQPAIRSIGTVYLPKPAAPYQCFIGAPGSLPEDDADYAPGSWCRDQHSMLAPVVPPAVAPVAATPAQPHEVAAPAAPAAPVEQAAPPIPDTPGALHVNTVAAEPAGCLIGAPGSLPDDDHEYVEDDWCDSEEQADLAEEVEEEVENADAEDAEDAENGEPGGEESEETPPAVDPCPPPEAPGPDVHTG